MTDRSDLLLRVLAGLLIVAGAGMLIAGITSTIPFGAIASGAALLVVLGRTGRHDRASHE